MSCENEKHSLLERIHFIDPWLVNEAKHIDAEAVERAMNELERRQGGWLDVPWDDLVVNGVDRSRILEVASTLEAMANTLLPFKTERSLGNVAVVFMLQNGQKVVFDAATMKRKLEGEEGKCSGT